jgi:Amt family ammonium transporter
MQWKWSRICLLSLFVVTGYFVTLALVSPGTAEAADPTNAELKEMADTAWTLFTAFLVFWMNAGFGCVEAGFCRAKNACNILAKNFVVFGLSSIAFWAVGWALMFGDGTDYIGLKGFFVVGKDSGAAATYEGDFSAIGWAKIPLFAKFFFQLVFAGTAATIVSGCVAERIHYKSFMIFAFLLVAVSYSITGHWIWGAGWLADKGMWDFAGSTVVHSVGGWAGLAGIILLGPRLGKFRKDGSVQPIPGHSMALAFLGGLILWLGWFGFNPGSTMAASPALISHIVVTTNMACAAGLISSTVTAWVVLGRPDFSMTVNGTLAGLVAITAPCAFVSAPASVVIGLVAGVLVVVAVLFFDKIKIDDPVGALSVHLANGIWGTLSIGLFANPTDVPVGVGYVNPDGTLAGPAAGLFYGGGLTQLWNQLIGVVAVGVFTMVFSLIVWAAIKATVGLRVSAEAEMEGLDVHEMGSRAYPEERALEE